MCYTGPCCFPKHKLFYNEFVQLLRLCFKNIAFVRGGDVNNYRCAITTIWKKRLWLVAASSGSLPAALRVLECAPAKGISQRRSYP